MPRVLYTQASPRKERSYSIAVADAFMEAYRQANPADEVVTQNLFEIDLPVMDGTTVQGKYNVIHGQDYTPEEKEAWTAVEEAISHFKSFDKYVFAVPMWNWSIPYKLKQYIDVLVQPSYTFGYNAQGQEVGLCSGPVFAAFARGNVYPVGTPAYLNDYQTTYFDFIMTTIGLGDIRKVIVGPTLAQGREVAQESKAQALAQAREMAAEF